MCGIFGYVGPQDPVKTCLEGLKRLEYRGYDSAGLAGIDKRGEVVCVKTPGKILDLKNKVEETQFSMEFGIGHTRWATHGQICEENSHPHTDEGNTLALVHNGIIENFAELKAKLKEEGVVFSSETDTEVIAQLLAKAYDGDVLEALQAVLPKLKGAFALVAVHRDHPEKMFVAARHSPLVIGLGNKESFIASDTSAFLIHTNKVIYLSDGEVGVVTTDAIEVYDETLEQVSKQAEELAHESEEISKGGYDHFMLKEIYEQPQTIRNALLARFSEELGSAVFEDLTFDFQELASIRNVIFLGCGSAYHTGLISSYLFEEVARVTCQVEISSEYRYKNPIVPPNSLVVAISQSGETADTLAAMRELKAKGSKIIAICNVQGSTLDREADATILLRSGTEVGVASTKAVTGMLIVQALLALKIARMRHMSKKEGLEFIQALKHLPSQVEKILLHALSLEAIAKKYAKYENFFFLGRQNMFPTSLEGALKLKEISYINANAYPAGELKHGPIALISPECPTVALCSHKATFDKMKSNMIEVKTRQGLVLAICEEGQEESLKEIVDDLFTTPSTIDSLSPILACVATQLLSYYIAKERKTEIDQPRNLAKSVTVE